MKLGFNTPAKAPRGNETTLVQANHMLEIKTPCRGFTEITSLIDNWLTEKNVSEGLLTVFICHTSASLLIQENADITVQYDLLDSLDQLAPVSDHYRHSNEGQDDMPAHIKCMLTQTSLTIPVQNGKTVLGTWQGVFIIEHRTASNTRKIALHFLGATASSQS